MERLHQPRNLAARCSKIKGSPIGLITLVANQSALLQLRWGDALSAEMPHEESASAEANEILDRAEKQLSEYFLGVRRTFDIPVDPIGTDFQKSAWKQLLKIPYGETISYGEQARRLNNLKATRAVGSANGRNPIGIIIPCHRVIGASGSLTGFGGGLAIKAKLLAVEGVQVSNDHVCKK